MQRAARDQANKLAAQAGRLNNSRTWEEVSATAAAFGALMECPPPTLLGKLGEAYALSLRLGQFLETDVRLQRDSSQSDGPLDPDIHGYLTTLVRIAAPWVRGFPTIAEWDDAAGKLLARTVDLIQPAREFARIARTENAISDRDAAEMKILADAADAEGFLGQKAGKIAVGDAINLMLVAADALAGAIRPDTSIVQPTLVQRARALLSAARNQVQTLAESRHGNLHSAVQSLIDDSDQPLPATSAQELVPPSIPENVEALAQEMILDGRIPPAEWTPHIRSLKYLFRTEVRDVSPLAGLRLSKRSI